jgi:FtsH-binding integral membrane protein
MDGLRLEVSHVACSHCGYTESNARLSGVGAFALGALVGLGIAALAAQFLKAE